MAVLVSCALVSTRVVMCTIMHTSLIVDTRLLVLTNLCILPVFVIWFNCTISNYMVSVVS